MPALLVRQKALILPPTLRLSTETKITRLPYAGNMWQVQLKEAYGRMLLDLQARHSADMDLLRSKMAQGLQEKTALVGSSTAYKRGYAHCAWDNRSCALHMANYMAVVRGVSH